MTLNLRTLEMSFSTRDEGKSWKNFRVMMRINFHEVKKMLDTFFGFI